MMKNIYLILLACFIIIKVTAQKAPCDYNKQDWQTAATNKDGSIYYQVETSSCNGNDICGEPKIILKHTFSKPAWFIIRLRGVDCSGRTLESEFHTGSKSIEPDKEFVSAKNWHVFKEVLNVVHVEVSYEKITEEVFRFDEKEEELKAAQTKKLEEEKRLAEEQIKAKNEAAVANNTKKTTPAKSNTPKQTAPVKQPTTPSVKKENTVEKPKTNDVVTQQSAEKPKTKSEKKEAKPVENTKQEVIASAVRNDFPDETIKSANTAKKEVTKEATPRTDEKPTEQPAKSGESQIVKYENGDADKVEETNQSNNDKDNTKTALPNIDNSNDISSNITSKDTAKLNQEPKVNHYNVVKTNIFYPLSLGYERGFAKHFSVVVNGFYLPSLSYGKPTGKLGYIELLKPSTGFALEGRYYTSKTKASLNGMYVGGFYSARWADVFMHRTISSSSFESTEIKLTAYSGLFMFGGMIGTQRIKAKGFTTDISFGLGYYNIPAVPLITDANIEPFKTFGWITKYRRGIGPRVTCSVGYAF
jgi:hypothetical protein